MRKTKVLFLMIFLISFIFVATSCTNSIALLIDAEKGDSYKYDVNSKTTFNMSMQGQTMEMVQELDIVYLVDIKDVDDSGNVTAEYKFDSMKITMETPAGTTSFDSSSSDENDLMSKMIGSSYTVKMSKNAEILDVSGLSEMMDSIIDPDNPSSEIFKDSFSEESIKGMFEQTTMKLPDEKIEPGYTWEDNISMDIMMPIDINTKYTLDKIEDGTASVSLDSKFSADIAEMMQELGMEAQGELAGTMTGDTEVNIRNAFITTGSVDTNLSGTIESNIQGTESSIQIDITSEATYTTTKQ